MDNRLILSGRYEVGEAIGYGGMATIHHAYDRSMDRHIALKILKPEYSKDKEMVARFINEAKAMHKLDHPHIVRVYGVAGDGGTYYIPMELVPGSTLKELIQKRGRIPITQAVTWALDVCDALSYAHSKRIIHRDIKPENILIDTAGMAKITDFGIAKVLDGAAMTNVDGDVLGSVQYIAPEQAQGKKTDEKTDIYSLGVTLYEMLTGKLPFTAETGVAVAMKHIRSVVVPPVSIEPSIPYSLSGVVVKALSKNPANRYATMEDFYNDLLRSVHEPDGTFADTVDHSIEVLNDAPVDPRKSVKKITMLIGASVVALMVFILIGILLLSGGSITEVTIPPLQGLYVDIATDNLTKAGLSYEVISVYSDLSEGIVVSSNPLEGQVVKAKSKVTLTVSQGPDKVQVPDLMGMDYRTASLELERLGLEIGTVEYSPQSDAPTGKVISQSPAKDQMVTAGTFINLAIDGYNPDQVTHTTSVLGRTVKEAIGFLKEDGFTNIVICESSSGAENRGLVTGQSPGGGIYAMKESLCILYVGNYRARGESGNAKVSVTTPSAGCSVVITVVEGDGEFVMYEETLSKGSHSVNVRLRCAEGGKKTLRIYCGGILTGTKEVEL